MIWGYRHFRKPPHVHDLFMHTLPCFQATLLHSDSHDTRHRLHTELLHCLCTRQLECLICCDWNGKTLKERLLRTRDSGTSDWAQFADHSS